MSATGRSDVRDPADYYATPAWATHRLLERVELPAGRWLEPCAGEGAIIQATQAVRGDVAWTALEVRAECREPLHDLRVESVQIGSFTAPTLPLLHAAYDVVLTNPPYRVALAFARRALELAPVVALLLRLNWLASAKRAAWMHAHTPSIFVLPDRPSFVGGHGDATEYAWLVWGLYAVPTVEILATTPKTESNGSPERERGPLELLERTA